ncbi:MULTISPECIES: DUF3613 domain-containing protein [Oceanimonas]|nr:MULTISPECIES: DUF3613 domain-containing protein [Oceanimonas]NHI02292.1 hypothetical protein [Oceanimonas sp. MB9]
MVLFRYYTAVALLALPSVLAANPLNKDRQGIMEQRLVSQTERWLQLQREGNAASTNVQASTPTEQELASQRWLDSYKHSIPERYEQGSEGKIGN